MNAKSQLAEPVAQAEETPKKRIPSSMPQSNLALRESKANDWIAIIPRGVPPERVLESDFWASVSRSFVPGDQIRCLGEARDFYKTLLVLESGASYCSLVELFHVKLPVLIVSQAGLPANHEILFSSADGYYVRRCSDNVVMSSGFNSRDEALSYLLDHSTLR